jgi:hypothetical protein
VRRAVARAYDGDYGANVTVLVVEPGGLRAPPPLTEAQSTQRAAVLAEVKQRASDGLPPTPADKAGNGTALRPVPFGVWVPPLRSDPDRIRVLMDFGQHGREFITSEVGLRLLEVLAAAGSSNAPDQAAADAALASAAGIPRQDSPRLRRLRTVLDRLSIVILPLENEGGRARVEAGARCERKNGRGVDPNRNWPLDWGRKEPDYDPAEEFPGRAPGSEPETRVVQGIATAFKPHAWVNVHSGMQALFTAFDHKARVPQGSGAKAALALLHRLDARACSGKCAVGSGGKSVGYLAHGTATDHMYSTEGVPLAFTWEIYGDDNASFDDCFRMFNPLDKEGFEQVVSTWVKASLSALELLPTHPQVAEVLFGGGTGGAGEEEKEEGGGDKDNAGAAGKEEEEQEAALRALFTVDAAKEPAEAAEAADAEVKAAALQAESATADAEEAAKAKRRAAVGRKGGAAASAAAAAAATEQEGLAATTDAAAASSPSSSSLPRRMGPQRQQHELGSPPVSADGDGIAAADGSGGGSRSGGGGGGNAASVALGITAAGTGARLFAVLPLLVVCGALAAVAVALAKRQRQQRQQGYLPTSALADDEGGFGFGAVPPPSSASSAAAADRRPAGGVSMVGVVGRRP